MEDAGRFLARVGELSIVFIDGVGRKDVVSDRNVKCPSRISVLRRRGASKIIAMTPAAVRTRSIPRRLEIPQYVRAAIQRGVRRLIHG